MDLSDNDNVLKTAQSSHLHLPAIQPKTFTITAPSASSSTNTTIPDLRHQFIINLPLTNEPNNTIPPSCTSCLTKSIGELNRLRTRHLMQHPLVDHQQNIDQENKKSDHASNNDNTSMSLLEYQKMLKESRRLEVELRKRSQSKPLIEIVEGQTCFTNANVLQQDGDQKSNNHVSFKNNGNLNVILIQHGTGNQQHQSQQKKGLKDTRQMWLRKCQSDNLITEKRRGQNRQKHQLHETASNSSTSEPTTSRNSGHTTTNTQNTTHFLSQTQRANSLNNNIFSPINSEPNPIPRPIPKKLPGRPSQLSTDDVLNNFRAKQLPPIIKKSNESSIPKYIDQLVTVKNNKDFYYSLKTNTIYPKSFPQKPISNGYNNNVKKKTHQDCSTKQFHKSKKKMNQNKKHQLSLSDFRRLSKSSEDDYYSYEIIRRRPSLGPCNSPIYFQSSVDLETNSQFISLDPLNLDQVSTPELTRRRVYK